MIATKLDTFTRAYLECALWSSTDDSDDSGGRPMDESYTVDDIAPGALDLIKLQCEQFQRDNAEDIASDLSRAGHDFWLTRCGHGAGFWDGDWEESAGERLTAAAHRFGNVDLYVGDDGLIYQM